MKRFFLPLFLFLSIGVGITSCNSDMEDYVAPENKYGEDKVFNITIDSQTYPNVAASYDEKGNLIFKDPLFSSIYNDFVLRHPDYSCFVKNDSSLCLYSDVQHSLNALSLTPIENGQPLLTRVITPNEGIGGVRLSDDTGRKGRSLVFVLKYMNFATSVSDLKDKQYKFNDKCSSLEMTNNLDSAFGVRYQIGSHIYKGEDMSLVFIGYEDKHFQGKNVVYIKNTGKADTLFSKLPGFNDKISSFKLFYAAKGKYSPKHK